MAIFFSRNQNIYVVGIQNNRLIEMALIWVLTAYTFIEIQA